MLRITAIFAAVFGTPALLSVALRSWLRKVRVALPSWRNGLGLSAFTLVLFAWLWFAIDFIAAISGRNPIDFDVFLLSEKLTILALILAGAWKAFARAGVMAACALMLIGYSFYGYV